MAIKALDALPDLAMSKSVLLDFVLVFLDKPVRLLLTT